ncbi:hypothetical protein KDA_24120 [Dictyobacter alpinus]|uniref:Uncharacterized protein n=1 Tax=Dictyobacter alpinus TaxID=2014873 RepID=A0A402B6F5_9CHLR|nr:hypothetical protein KDA_24120 [Dictyobacter alpinus]
MFSTLQHEKTPQITFVVNDISIKKSQGDYCKAEDISSSVDFYAEALLNVLLRGNYFRPGLDLR